ncbi:MAG: hypothetical protein RJB05_1434, partial [Armatimonadota bacterium]
IPPPGQVGADQNPPPEDIAPAIHCQGNEAIFNVYLPVHPHLGRGDQ